MLSLLAHQVGYLAGRHGGALQYAACQPNNVQNSYFKRKATCLFVENKQRSIKKTYVGTAFCCWTLPGTRFFLVILCDSDMLSFLLRSQDLI